MPRACVFLLLAGGPALAQDVLPTPAGPESGQYALTAGEEGRILLSWIEPSEAGGHAFRFAELLEEGWGEPRTIVQGPDFFVNWADRPAMVAIGGDRLAAHWLRKDPDHEGAYGSGIRLLHSFDRGETWREVYAVDPEDPEGYAGFVSWTREPGGFSGAYLTPKSATEDVMTLRVARFHIDGHPLGDQLLDDLVCDCCPTGMAASSLGPLVAYRDRRSAPPEDDVRDIMVRRRAREVWQPGRLVHPDGWRINGCPVNGPAVAASGNTVAVAWFTLAAGEPEMRIAFSGNAAEDFAPPTRFDGGAPRGWPDIALLDDGTAAILWLERGAGNRGEVRLRRMTPDGLPSASLLVAEAPAGREAGVLQMERQDDRLLIAWRDGGVRTASVAIAALTDQPGSGGR